MIGKKNDMENNGMLHIREETGNFLIIQKYIYITKSDLNNFPIWIYKEEEF